MKNRTLFLIGGGSLILIWKLVSLFMDSPIILPSPESSLFSLVDIIGEEGFLPSLGATVLRGLGGFFIAALAALVVGIIAGENRAFYMMIRPLLTVIKTVPVLSIVLLAIIWLKSESVPLFVCFLVVFPVISANVIEGMRNVDPGLLQMARVYRVSRFRVLRQIYLPSLLPYLLAGLTTAAGVTWKAVVAAEVIAMPPFGIGTSMQYAQLQLDTGRLFAWTIVAVLISSFSEMLLHRVDRLFPWRRP